MIAFVIFAVILLLLAGITARDKEWFNSLIYILLSIFFVWICFQFRI